MKISDAMEKAINQQIQEEFESAFLYLTMATWFESKDLSGFSHWMRIQFQEEQGHAMKMYAYLLERAGNPEVPPIKKWEKTWKTPADPFAAAYQHEQHISACIYAIVEKARKEGDFASDNFFQYFVKEQVEEEAAVLQITKQLKMVGESAQGIYLLDRQLATRNVG